MPSPAPTTIDPLIAHLTAVTAMPPEQALRLIEDVLAFFSETVEDFAARRHAELQANGFRNDAIFETLIQEIEHHRFATQPLTARQIRRLIYG